MGMYDFFVKKTSGLNKDIKVENSTGMARDLESDSGLDMGDDIEAGGEIGIDNDKGIGESEKYMDDSTKRNFDEEYSLFDEEYSLSMYDMSKFDDISINYNDYSDNGVTANRNNDSIEIIYRGLLAKSGAQDVYAVIGYGDNENWKQVKYYPMKNIGQQTFSLVVPVESSDNINVAFKDGADHWDNNSGKNYCFAPATDETVYRH